MEFLKNLEQLFKDVAYLKERDETLTHSVKQLMAMVPNEIKGYQAASKFLGVSVSTLERLVRERKILYSKNGKAISFSMKHLLEWKESRLIKRNPNLPSITKL